MKKQSVIAVLLFTIGVLVFTRMDFLINSSLYDYGLRFSQNWHIQYTSLYLLCYQLLIISLSAYSRNFKLLVLMEVFVLTCTQDLIYFGLWQGAFPIGEWTWMPFFNIFGTWTTTHQLLLSFSTNIIAALMILAVSMSRRRATSWLRPPMNSYSGR